MIDYAREAMQAEAQAQTTYRPIHGGAMLGTMQAERDHTPSDLSAISIRIASASAFANEIARRIMGMADKHYGPVVEKNGAESPSPLPAGNVEEAYRGLDSLERQLRFLSDQVERLAKL